MSLYISQDENADDFLEHFGVKGMKWGQRRQAKLERLNRVASGTGNLVDKARVAATMTNYDIARGGGFKGAAGRTAARMEGRKSRMAAGKATFMDTLLAVGNVSTVDIYLDKGKQTNRKRKIANALSLIS